MPSAESSIALCFKNKVYLVQPDFELIREIEGELGSAILLLESFSQKSWKVSDLVTMVHMMLQAAGETVDYFLLGNQMLKEGVSRYLSAVLSFLQLVLQTK